MSQTTTPTIDQARGIPGQLADVNSPKRVLSSFSDVNIVIGSLVCFKQSIGDDGVKVPAAGADITNLTKGIALHSHTIETTDLANPTYLAKKEFPVLRKGAVIVSVEDAVTAGQPAFVNHTGATAGAFRSDVNGGNATQVPTSRYLSSTTGAGLAIVELNLD